jgi:hypothetical protein
LFVHLCEGSKQCSHVEHDLTRLLWHVLGWENCRGGNLTNQRSDRLRTRSRWMHSAPEFLADPFSPGPLPDDFTREPDLVAKLARIVFDKCNLAHPWVANQLIEE